MRFLADESCDFAVVRALRKAGYDVMSVSEKFSGINDSEVIKLANKEKRIPITEDKDFGQLVFAHGRSSNGVIFLRYRFAVRNLFVDELVKSIDILGKKLENSFVVILPGMVRIARRE